MSLIRDAAVVLGRLDYSETSQILVLFTRQHGKVRAIAKGARRSTKSRFSPGIDLLEIGAVVLSVRQERAAGLATLTEWKQTVALSGLRSQLDRIHAAQYAAEITTKLTEDWDPHEELFESLIDALGQLSESTNPLGPILRYQHTLLDRIGSLPRFDACVACGREEGLTHFSSFEGGLICRNCEPGRVEKWEVSDATITLLRPAQDTGRIEINQALSGAGDENGGRVGAFSVLNYHISHLMGAAPRVADLLVSKDRRRRV